MKTISIKEIRKREQDLEAHAQAVARMDGGNDTLSVNKDRMNRLAHQAIQETTHSRKLEKVREIVAILADALEGVAACKSGCSQCCHIPVSMTQAEANVIGAAIGIDPATPQYSVKADYTRTGTACRFLVDNQCSIYENRPLACRLCFNMDDDELLCTLIEGEKIEVPYFNGLQFELLWLKSLGKAEGMKLAGLHEFFPIN